MIFRVDAPPVATEEIRAATDEEGRGASCSSRRTDPAACSAPASTHAPRSTPGCHDPPHVGPVAVPLLRSRVGACDRPGALAGRNLVGRFGAADNRARSGSPDAMSTGNQHSTVVPCARRADHPSPPAGELGALHHRGDAEVSGLGRRLEIGHETPPVVDHAHHDAVRGLGDLDPRPSSPPRACATLTTASCAIR